MVPSFCYVLSWENCIYTVLFFIVTRGTLSIGNKFLDREFHWSVIMNFIPDWKSGIVDQYGLKTTRQEIDVIAQKWKLFGKKNSFI